MNIKERPQYVPSRHSEINHSQPAQRGRKDSKSLRGIVSFKLLKAVKICGINRYYQVLVICWIIIKVFL